MEHKSHQEIYLSLDHILLLEAAFSYFAAIFAARQQEVFRHYYFQATAIKLFENWFKAFFTKFNQATNFSKISATSLLLEQSDKYYLGDVLKLFSQSEHLARAVAYKAEELVEEDYCRLSAMTSIVLNDYQCRLKAMDSLLLKIKAKH